VNYLCPVHAFTPTPSPHRRVAPAHTPRVALPFLKITLNAPKPKPANYPANPKTLGEHIRKKRMDLGLLQRELAEIIGVNACTIHNWEMSYSLPQERLIPKIIEFIGYDPRDP
jgi:DNA-binding XRE family transcriptional regulator